MKNKILLFLGCLVFTILLALNVKIAMSDFSIGSNTTLKLEQKAALANDESSDNKVRHYQYYEGLGKVCVGGGSEC